MTSVAENFASRFPGDPLMEKVNTRSCSFKRSVAASLCEAMPSPTGRRLQAVNSGC